MLKGCERCMNVLTWVLLIIGILYLGQDLNWWSFWQLNWWTVTFLFLGMTHIATGTCKACRSSLVVKKK